MWGWGGNNNNSNNNMNPGCGWQGPPWGYYPFMCCDDEEDDDEAAGAEADMDLHDATGEED